MSLAPEPKHMTMHYTVAGKSMMEQVWAKLHIVMVLGLGAAALFTILYTLKRCLLELDDEVTLLGALNWVWYLYYRKGNYLQGSEEKLGA